jgi:hypothetical protein
VILQSDKNDPILATWQYGLGRSAAFASDATGHWGRDWVSWKDFPAFWAQVVRYTIGETQNVALSMNVRNKQDNSVITLDALTRAGEFLNGYQVKASIVSPSGKAQSTMLRQVAPGRYEGTFDPMEQGTYVMRFTGSDAGGGAFSETEGWTMSYSPEYRETQPNPDLLLRLATITGGKVAPPNPAAAFEHSLKASRATRPIAPWLIVLAALLLPIDVAARRLVLTRIDILRWRDALAARIPTMGQSPAPATQPDARIDALLRSKERAQYAAAKHEAGAEQEKSTPSFHPADTDVEKQLAAAQGSGKKPSAAPESAPALTQALLARKKQLKKKDE